MNKEEFAIFSLSAFDGAEYSPIQVQKLLFLLDDRVSPKLGGPFYNFIPYHYGPFDSGIYELLNKLSKDGLVIIGMKGTGRRSFKLSEKGRVIGKRISETIPPELNKKTSAIEHFVRKSSFMDLVMAIYNAYPEMKAKSILFKEAPTS